MRASTTTPQEAINLVDLFFNSGYGGVAADVSMLYVLAQIAGFGDAQNVGTIERGISSEGGAQESRFVGGSQQLSIKAAEQLGSRLVLNAPVRSITQTSSRASVTPTRGPSAPSG